MITSPNKKYRISFFIKDTYTGNRNDPLSLNLYTYCFNEPLMYNDLNGHNPANIVVNGQNVGNAQVNNGVSTGNLTDVVKGLTGSTSNVVWDPSTKTATAKIGDKTISYNLNNVGINGVGKASDGSTFTVVNGRIQVGIRSISESAGANVQWSNNSGTIAVNVTSTNAGPAPVNTPVPSTNPTPKPVQTPAPTQQKDTSNMTSNKSTQDVPSRSSNTSPWGFGGAPPSDWGNNGTHKDIINGLINDNSLGLNKAKKDAIIDMAIVLLNEGFEPEFVAGVLGNVIAEGTSGLFESSAYTKNPSDEPDYLKYMDENYDYRTKFSGKTLSEVGISETYSVLKELEKGGYKGKFGLGSIQWTGGRTMVLINTYIELYGENYYPTVAECRIAENRMIINELKGAYYNKRVYQNWKSQYGNSNGGDAAYWAGSIVCYKYEIPSDTDKKAKIRANNAKNVYNVMMGNK